MGALRVVVYAAKSTVDERGSIPDQIEACGKFAAVQGWVVDGRPETDQAASAYSGNRGPGLRRALERAKGLAAADGRSGLLVWHSNRLARGGGDSPTAARHLGELLFEAQRTNVELHSVQDDASLTNPLLAFVVGQQNFEESRIKGENVKRGMARRRGRGLHTGGAIYGYVRDGVKGLQPHPDQAATVGRIFRLVAAGKSQLEIVRTLNAEGSQPLRARRWTQGSLSRLLRNRTYLGELEEGGEWREAVHEGLVPRTLWDAATRQREAAAARKGRKGGPRPKAGHLLTGHMLRHAACGHAMTPRSNGARKDGTVTGVYECAGRKGGLCEGFRVGMKTVDDAVVGYLADVGIDVDRSLRLVRDATEAHRSATAAELDAAQREQAKVEGERARMWSYLKAGDLTAEEWRTFEAENAEDQAACNARVARLGARAAVGVEPEALVPAVADALGLVRTAMSNGDTDAVRVALAALFSCFMVGSLEDMPDQTFISTATEQKAARGRLRDRLASMEREAGRPIADVNAQAMAEEAVMDLPEPPPEGDQGRRHTPGVVVVPQPREDAFEGAAYLVDERGRPILRRIPLLMTNNDAFTT